MVRGRPDSPGGWCRSFARSGRSATSGLAAASGLAAPEFGYLPCLAGERPVRRYAPVVRGPWPGAGAIAVERRGAWDAVAESSLDPAAADGRSVAPRAGDGGGSWSAAVIHAEIDALGQVDLDALERTDLQQLLVEMRGPLRRLEAARAKVTGALQRREAAGRNGPHAGDRECREFLTGQLGLPPAEATEVTATSKRLADAPTTREAYDEGRLTSKHTAVITSCLPHIPYQHRTEVEAQLVGLAASLDPVALGRKAREFIAAHDAQRLRTVEKRRQTRRRFSYHPTADGGLRFSGELFGVDAEAARTAFDAFTPPPSADDQRSHDHRRADGLVTLAHAALRAGQAPTQHNVRPHVLVTIPYDQLAKHRAGEPATARLAGGEHVTFEDAWYVLADCDITRIVLDAAGTPIEASEAVRTVPTGLWRALQARDKGCTWQGCTAPTSWCDVAHLEDPFATGGRLRPDTAALLCRRHHRRFDAGGWRAEVCGDTVTYHPDPDRPPVTTIIERHRRQPTHPPPQSTSSTSGNQRAPTPAPGAV